MSPSSPEALVLDRLFDELADYTVYHFTSEEAIWREYLSNSEHEVEHRKTHALFVQEVMRLRGELASRPMMDVAEEALGFLARWLASHILESDRYGLYRFWPCRPACHSMRQRQEPGSRWGQHAHLIDIILSIYGSLSNNTLRLMRSWQHRQLQSSLQEAKAELEEATTCCNRWSFTAAPVRIFWKDKQLNYLGCNPIFAQDAGKQGPGEVIGKRLSNGLGSPSRSLSGRRSPGYRNRPGPSSITKNRRPRRMARPSGCAHPRCRSPGALAKPSVCSVFTTTLPIASWPSRALRQSEHKFHSLYSAMTEGVALHELVFDAQGKAVDYRLLDANPAFETILGIPGKRPSGVVPARSSAGFPSRRSICRSGLTGKPLRFQPGYAPMARFSISVFSPAGTSSPRYSRTSPRRAFGRHPARKGRTPAPGPACRQPGLVWTST